MAGIYIHIPFCRAKCAYCDFFSGVITSVNADDYINAIFAECDARLHELGGEKIDTIYIGGGTPSSLPASQLIRLVERFATFAPGEFTIEVNPEDVSHELTRQLLHSGINRISMGIQSFSDAELAIVGRRHSATDALRAFDTLRQAGAENISIDLIYGLPGQTDSTWESSLRQAIALNPEHISAYALSFEPRTRLYAMLQTGKIHQADDTAMERRYNLLCDMLSSAGFRHYEIANFAKPGHHSRHNSSYWNLTPYLGLGVSAHSLTASGRRRFNPIKIAGYIADPTAYTLDDEETSDEKFNDYIMIRLRTDTGIDFADLKRRFGTSTALQVRDKSAALLKQSLLVETSSGVRIPEQRWLVADAVTISLFR